MRIGPAGDRLPTSSPQEQDTRIGVYNKRAAQHKNWKRGLKKNNKKHLQEFYMECFGYKK